VPCPQVARYFCDRFVGDHIIVVKTPLREFDTPPADRS
jgi:hypothetical protein